MFNARYAVFNALQMQKRAQQLCSNNLQYGGEDGIGATLRVLLAAAYCYRKPCPKRSGGPIAPTGFKFILYFCTIKKKRHN